MNSSYLNYFQTLKSGELARKSQDYFISRLNWVQTEILFFIFFIFNFISVCTRRIKVLLLYLLLREKREGRGTGKKSQSVGIALQYFHPLYCRSSRLKPPSARNVCKQACPFWSYDRHMSIINVALVQPLTSSVRWRMEVFKIQGFVRKRFLPSPPPPPLSYFGSRPNFARAKYRSGFVPWSFFAPQPHGNTCYVGYRILVHNLGIGSSLFLQTVRRRNQRIGLAIFQIFFKFHWLHRQLFTTIDHESHADFQISVWL